jgi:hypothetical protein
MAGHVRVLNPMAQQTLSVASATGTGTATAAGFLTYPGGGKGKHLDMADGETRTRPLGIKRGTARTANRRGKFDSREKSGRDLDLGCGGG